jgi:hypothetical protein
MKNQVMMEGGGNKGKIVRNPTKDRLISSVRKVKNGLLEVKHYKCIS